MLILNRRRGEAIVVDGGIRIVVLECDRRGTRIGIDAPAATNIQREELLERVANENRRARARKEQEWAKALPVRGAPVTSATRPGVSRDRKPDNELPSASLRRAGGCERPSQVVEEA